MSLSCLLATRTGLLAGMPDPEAWLSETERARRGALGSQARRNGFVAGRWLARLAVRRWRGGRDLPALDVAPTGACHVAGGGVFVSISHTGDHLACAVAARPVGVDIEGPARPRDYLGLASVVHGPDQRERLQALAPGLRAQAFLQDWTLKEAWLKAREQGLDFALMRALAFEADPRGDAGLAELDGLTLAVVVDGRLPETLDCEPAATWRRLLSRQLPAG